MLPTLATTTRALKVKGGILVEQVLQDLHFGCSSLVDLTTTVHKLLNFSVPVFPACKTDLSRTGEVS